MRLVLLLLLAAACGEKELVCDDARECVSTRGDPGVCLEMRCAFPDLECTSGYRWDDTAGEMANECVAPAIVPDAGAPDAG